LVFLVVSFLLAVNITPSQIRQTMPQGWQERGMRGVYKMFVCKPEGSIKEGTIIPNESDSCDPGFESHYRAWMSAFI
jgi:hypothetical protein